MPTEPTVTELLGRAPFFADLPKRSLRSLAKLCVPRSFPAGTMMIEEGGVGLGLFVITSGRVEVFKADGDERVQLAVLSRGDLIGEMALIDDKPRSASAVTLDEVECLLITRDSFHTLVHRDPEISWCIVPVLAERLRSLQRRVIDLVDDEPDGDWRPEIEAGQARADREPKEAMDAEEANGGEVGEAAGVERASLGLALLRAQHATLMATVTGLSGSVALAETFLRELADTSRLADNGSVGEVARRLPRGLESALRATLRQGERLPERVVSSFRRNWKR